MQSNDRKIKAMLRSDHEAIRNRILSFLQREVKSRNIDLTMDAPVMDVGIDSIDIVRVLFKVEEEFGIEIELSPTQDFTTVGAFIDELVALIPADAAQ
jgi:acyl carrier protein